MPIGGAHAETQRTTATAQIEQQGGIGFSGNVALQTAGLSMTGSQPGGNVLAATSPSPALVTVSGLPGSSVSLSTPDALALSREGGLESLQLKLGQALEGGGGATLLSTSGGVSLGVVGSVEDPGIPIVPGDYRGLLIIIAQWN
jgi:hypothetical protein